MADKAITDLTQATQITGEDLFVLEQSGEAKKLKGSQVVQYAKDAVAAEVQGVKEYADNAKASADAAAASATKAATAAQGIDDKVAAADASAKAAASSAAAAAASATGVDEKVQAAQTAADNAAKSETAAKNAQTAAANAQKAAESAQTGAQAAKTAAESAQEAAESAKGAAADSSTSAGQKATQAAQSAEDAASAKSAAETAKTDAQAARDSIVNMIVEAVTLETGKPATVSKSLVDNVYKLAFGLPRGETGAPGPKGVPGNGISGIALKSGTHAPGTSDVYTITLTDGTTFDFEVYNGANGAGAGDMLASVYDPQGKRTDVYKYVDDAVKAIHTPDVSGKLDKPANDATATVGQLLTKTADGQEWKDREEDMFVVNMTSSDMSNIDSVDKTFEEVQAALVAGKTVVARIHLNSPGTGNSGIYDLMKVAWIKDELIAFSLTAMRGTLLAITMYPEKTSLSQFLAQPKITATGLLKGDEDGVIAATAGTDYVDPDGDGSNLTAAFATASTRANIATGEKLSVLFGKIAKWFADLGALAFKDKVAKTDLTTEVQQSIDTAGETIQIKLGGEIPYNTNTGTLRPSDASVNFDKVVNWINGGKQIRVIAYVRISDIPAEPGRLVFLQLNETSATGGSLSEANWLGFSANDAWNNRTLEISVNLNNQWTYKWKPYGKVAPATTSILKGDGAGGVVAATPETDYASPETMRKVTLTVAGWSSSTKQQTVAVPGVLADGTKQKVICSPVDESYDSAWNTCYVQCVGHAADSLTFQCDEIPTAAVEVFVSIQPVNFVS